MNISTEFQEFVLIVVAPLVYDGISVLLVLSIFVAVAMPLIELGQVLRRLAQKGV